MWAQGNQWNMPLDAAAYQNMNHELGNGFYFIYIILKLINLIKSSSGLGFTGSAVDSHERSARNCCLECS